MQCNEGNDVISVTAEQQSGFSKIKRNIPLHCRAAKESPTQRCRTLFRSKTKVPRENQCHWDTKETDMDTGHGLQRLLYVEFRISV